MWYLVIGEDDILTIVERDTKPLLPIYGGVHWMISPGYKTKEDIIKRHKILNHPCKCCGGLIRGDYHYSIQNEMTSKTLCYICNIWDKRVIEYTQSNIVVINQRFYTVGTELPPDVKGFKGYGGAKFRIEKVTGEIIETTNLWAGGKISNHWLDKFPNNAKFLNI